MKRKFVIALLAVLIACIGWRIVIYLANRPDNLAIHNLYGCVREVVLSGNVEAIRSVLAPEYRKNHTADDTESMFRGVSDVWIASEDWAVRFERKRDRRCGPTAWIAGQEPLPEYRNATRFAYYAPKGIAMWSSGVEFEFVEIDGEWMCTGDWIRYYD